MKVVMNPTGGTRTTTYRKFLENMASYFFSSTNLMQMLLEQETYSCGTTRANRINWPTAFRKPNVLKQKRGESRKIQHEDLTAVVWQEKFVVLISTNPDPWTDGLVTRKTGKGNEEMETVAVQLATASLAIMVASHNDATKIWPIIVGLLGQRIENAVLAK